MDSKQSMGAAAENFSVIGARMLDIALQRGIEAGIKEAMSYLAEEKEKAYKSRYDRRLRNTRLLLKNYRSLRKHIEGAIYSTKQVRENAIDILDGLDEAALDDSLYVEGIKKSQQRTIIILNHVDEMLTFYRIGCEQSGKDEDMRRYRTIMAMYINENKLTAQQIAEKECVEVRTVYKDITTAIKPISALIFGIDSIKLN